MKTEIKFHHIGIACRDIEFTKAFYLNQGYKASETVEDPIQNVFICFLSKDGEPLLELLAPVDEKSPINRTLSASGVTPYHICYQVKSIEDSIKSLKTQRFVRVSRPAPACALDNKRVCFLYNKDVGLIELVEE